MTSMIDIALFYIKQGFAVFPVHSINASGHCTCGNPTCGPPGTHGKQGKHPIAEAVPHGHKDATLNPHVASAWFKKYPWANIAIATGELSGNLVVIDIDNKPDRGIMGEETWFELRETFNNEPETPNVLTGSGGRHIYFRVPGELAIRSGTNKLGAGIDVRALGGYVVAPPSLHISGNRYDWDADLGIETTAIMELPEWLAKKLKDTPQKITRNAPAILLSQREVNEIRSALNTINPDERDTWLEIGMALHSTYADMQAYELWRTWSEQSNKYDPREQLRVWRSFTPEQGITIASLFHHAKNAGWFRPEPEAVSLSDIEPTITSHSLEEPQKLYEPPGLTGQLVAFMNDTALYRQPAFNTIAALCFLGCIMGGKVSGTTGVRTNLYGAAIGPTACGKEHAVKVIKHLAQSVAGLEDFLGGETIASGQAILTRLSIHSNILFQLDEFGLMLKSLMSTGAAHHHTEIMKNLMTLYSKSNSTYLSTEYADQKARPRITIDYPCVCMYGTSTPSEFYGALGSASIANGFLNRIIIVNPKMGRRQRQRNRISKKNIPDDIITTLENLRDLAAGDGDLAEILKTNPAVIQKSPDCIDFADSIELYIDNEYTESIGKNSEGMWGRVFEQIEKIAVIVAVANCPDKPMITHEIYQWASNFVIYHTHTTIKALLTNVSDTHYEKLKNSFLKEIENSKNRGLTTYEMSRKKPFNQIKPGERSDIIADLLDSGLIQFAEISTGGRGRSAYIALQSA